MNSEKNLFSAFIILITVTIAFSGILSCESDPADTGKLRDICFESEVLPIFLTNCALSGCHDDATGKEGYTFTSYDGIMEGVEPDNPKASPVYRSLTDKWSDDMMPPDRALPLASRTIIMVWIAQGARHTTCDTTDSNAQINPKGDNFLSDNSNISTIPTRTMLIGAVRKMQGFFPMPPANNLPLYRVREFEPAAYLNN